MNDKMIEEMAEDLKANIDCDYGGIYYRESAENLYTVGYRKIPEGSVVLSKEQNAKWSELFDQTRKETAKEFASKVKECKEIKELVEFGYIVSYVDLCKEIDEISKQFGVEVEE